MCCNDYFEFGSPPAVQSKWAWIYPVALKGGPEQLWLVADVPTSCPGLVARVDMKRFQVRYYFDVDQTYVAGQVYDMEFTDSGHPALTLTEFAPGSDPEAVWRTPMAVALMNRQHRPEVYQLDMGSEAEVASEPPEDSLGCDDRPLGTSRCGQPPRLPRGRSLGERLRQGQGGEGPVRGERCRRERRGFVR